ncbi:hypothetical protein [Streptomyces rimosus]
MSTPRTPKARPVARCLVRHTTVLAVDGGSVLAVSGTGVADDRPAQQT